MQIQTIRKGFEACEWKFEAFESGSKYSNENSNHSIGIRSIRMQIRIIRKGFEVFECKFEAFERDSMHSKGIRGIRKGFEVFESDSKHSNANSKHVNENSKHFKVIRSIIMKILTI